MKMAAIVLVAASVWAGEPGTAQARGVRICMSRGKGNEFQVTYSAQEMASKMFAVVGVKLSWQTNAACPSSPDVIRVSLSLETPETQSPGAMAYALPYEGTHIVVFYDRVKDRAKYVSVDRLLAHVLVHEITHILQGSSRHSETGIMKAHWDNRDLVVMDRKPFGFTGEDVRLIYRGLELRQARPMGTTSIAAQ